VHLLAQCKSLLEQQNITERKEICVEKFLEHTSNNLPTGDFHNGTNSTGKNATAFI
jgi:hypothetical protein